MKRNLRNQGIARIFMLLPLLFCCHVLAFPLGLGQIKVLSGLNQPCRLEIPIINPNHLPLQAIKVRFTSSHAKKHPLLRGVIAHQKGEGVILISSTKRIIKPYMQLSLHVSSPEGMFKRRFLVMLDPIE